MQQIEFPNITTERLSLARLSHSDKQAIFAVFSDPEVIAHYDVERFTDPEEASRLVDYFDSRFEDDSGIRWAIRDKASGAYLGSCGYTNWNQYDHSAVVSYELAPQYWGKGYAFEAVNAIIAHVFSEHFHFFVQRIEALILPSNLASQKLVSKLGFVKEGTLRKKCYWNGDFHDMDMFSILRDEFRTG